MIPDIDEILLMLMGSRCTKEQARGWIEAHMDLARNYSSDDLRDGFAASVLQGLIAHHGIYDERNPKCKHDFYDTEAARVAYLYADAMLKARRS